MIPPIVWLQARQVWATITSWKAGSGVPEQSGQPNPLHLLNHYRLELFHAHCSLIDQLFLRHWEAHLQARSQDPERTTWNCVLVDDRATRQTRTCVLNTLLMTRLQATVTIYTPNSKKEAFFQLLEPFSRFITIKTLDDFGITDSLGWNKYNTLFKSADFWKTLTGEHVLIFQPDALVIQPLELEELHYDFAGPPWNKGRITSCEFPTYDPTLTRTGSQWANQALCQTVPDHTNNGNGGLSIRNPRVMQAICEQHSHASPDTEAEDIFFARHLNDPNLNAKLPSQAVLNRLFNESSYSDSSGFHGSWYYLDASEQARLYEKHAKHVIGMLLGLG
ncbi:hypothetical protein CB0101_09155 [Synechococcus sp. CB0101]|uniref:DUF5672 family protein n=1 Tax=Synechococcus sp. CB0101 TaxID=232348 RepID=UPI0010AA5932|nr:DUF5672 family protein [Synechococcus sp. CB0101]QCH15075.1 hypothetical protein CB0101_09155 [Synechococcus sp. CB0101]